MYLDILSGKWVPDPFDDDGIVVVAMSIGHLATGCRLGRA